MLTDIEIAQKNKILKINEIANKINCNEDEIEPIGFFKGKFSSNFIDKLSEKKLGKLILVTALSPTPAGEGKTTTTVGLGDALNALNKNTMICLREPSLGPVFGIKGGAAGGGYSQVIPMEDINLHFTGDFNAIQLANNLLSAMIDNHIHQGNKLEIDSRKITWKRVLDMNDRSLRSIVIGLGTAANGFTREDGFDIVVASEVMAILCLAQNFEDLKRRLGQIVIGYSKTGTLITASQLNDDGAMEVLLKYAFRPNLVQTLESNPAIIHGGPFANIAHGCNSISATKLSLQLSDYVVTEAGFGADLGAEKFLNIKCRKMGTSPDATVIVCTLRALKYHGGVELSNINEPNLDAIKTGFSNLKRHIENINNHFGIPVVVCLNHFSTDTNSEIDAVKGLVLEMGCKFVVSKHWAQGSTGAKDLAEEVIGLCDQSKSKLNFTYHDDESLEEKINKVAKSIYKAREVKINKKLLSQLKSFEDLGFKKFPICIAKTQYSFSSDPTLRGAPDNHTLEVREVRLMAGAEFIVVICGDIMTMPGLPKIPSAEKINISGKGLVTGLF
ncbi:MAG: formate--tetrahydrofolate ligase [Hydrogenophilales bacterium]